MGKMDFELSWFLPMEISSLDFLSFSAFWGLSSQSGFLTTTLANPWRFVGNFWGNDLPLPSSRA